MYDLDIDYKKGLDLETTSYIKFSLEPTSTSNDEL